MAKMSFTMQIDKVLKDYAKDVDEALKTASLETADDAKEQLRKTSPVRTGRYAAGWIVSAERTQLGRQVWKVHNKDHYRLTHLLERGHATRNGGRTRAFPHIKKAETIAKRNLVRRLKEQLK